MEKFTGDIGAARRCADENATRSGFPWVVVLRHIGFGDRLYGILPEVESQVQYDHRDSLVYRAKPKPDKVDEEAILVTEKEKELLAFILGDPNDRRFYPGTEEVKLSLLAKIRKSLKL